jgi:hypothetical protein
VAGILTLDAKSTNEEHCDNALRSCDAEGRDAAESGRLYGTLTTAGPAVGLVGVGLGTYFIVASGPNETGVTAQGSPMGGRVTLVQRWSTECVGVVLASPPGSSSPSWSRLATAGPL